MEPSSIYKLMIYFAHSTMVMYSKTITLDRKMAVHDFREANADVVKRVYDEALSIFDYELSNEQLNRACLVYMSTTLFPQSVNESPVFEPSNTQVW